MQFSQLATLLVVLLRAFGEIGDERASHLQEDCAGVGNIACGARLFHLTAARRDVSCLNCDKKGQPKIKGGPHLTQSGAYPIHLGLKAGIGLFSVALVSQLLIFLLVWHSKKRPPQVFPEKAFSYSFAIFLTGFGGLFLRCQTNRKIAIPNICVWSFLKIGRWEPYSVPTCYLADLGHLNEYMSAPIP